MKLDDESLVAMASILSCDGWQGTTDDLKKILAACNRDAAIRLFVNSANAMLSQTIEKRECSDTEVIQFRQALDDVKEKAGHSSWALYDFGASGPSLIAKNIEARIDLHSSSGVGGVYGEDVLIIREHLDEEDVLERRFVFVHSKKR